MGAFEKVFTVEKELEQLVYEMEEEEKAGKPQSETLLLNYTGQAS
jgi:hypothetical protein